MGELEVIMFLRKNKDNCYSVKELAEYLKDISNEKCITRAVKKLNDRKEIKSIILPSGFARRIYNGNHKKPMRVYYL